jgi:large subunit ribosomal protein L17
MRHLKAGRKLNRTAAHRKALMRNLVKALLQREQIRTTDAKAKELRRWADRIVTLGKRGSLHARRLAFAYLGSRKLVKRLFDEVAPRFQGRAGGYTRVLKIGPRRGDAAPLSLVEFTVRGQRTAGKASSSGGGKTGE